MKYYIFLIFLPFCYKTNSQSLSKIELKDTAWKILNVASVNCLGSTGFSETSKFCGLNCASSLLDQSAIMLLSFISGDDMKAYIINHKSGKLQLKKMISNGDSEILLLGSYEWVGHPGFIFIATYNTKLNSITNCKLLSDLNLPDTYYDPIDFISDSGSIYILASLKVQYLNESKSKTVLIKYDGNTVLWAKAYNLIAPIHSESPQSIFLTSTDDILVSGLVHASGDSVNRMMLLRFDKDGNPLNFKRIQLLSSNLKYSNQVGWTFVKSKFTNIHLFAQTVESQQESAQVLVTLFDNNLSLRTWRNYEIPIRVESSMIENDFFYFGGQAPLASGYTGYTVIKVNSFNAIVESVKNFQKELNINNGSSSSAACYDRKSDRIYTFVATGELPAKSVVMIQNNRRFDMNCATDLSSKVAKDTIRINDLNLSSKDLSFQVNEFDCYVAPVELIQTQHCNTTLSVDFHKWNISYEYAMDRNLRINAPFHVRQIYVYDAYGNLVYTNSDMGSDFVIHTDLCPGIYVAVCTGNSNQKAHLKFVAY